jgi:hypothetical protein
MAFAIPLKGLAAILNSTDFCIVYSLGMKFAKRKIHKKTGL